MGVDIKPTEAAVKTLGQVAYEAWKEDDELERTWLEMRCYPAATADWERAAAAVVQASSAGVIQASTLGVVPISVADSLPPKNTEVFVCFAGQSGLWSTGQYIGGRKGIAGWCYPQENLGTNDDGSDPLVTHWAWMPEVPAPASSTGRAKKPAAPGASAGGESAA